MKTIRISALVLSAALCAALAACDQGTKQQLATLQHTDSVRVDSLAAVQKSMLEEVMTSTQFVNDINAELAKARAIAAKPPVRLASGGEMADVNDQRKQVVARISALVTQLNAAQARLAATRREAAALSNKDSTLLAEVDVYQKNLAQLQASADSERAAFQHTIDQQTAQIALLNGRVDTLTQVRTALVDTVNELTTEKNAAYYVIGTRDELIKKGVLVAEGQKRFLIVGSRTIAPARQLDPSQFTRIDRLATRTIPLPAGQYEIVSRQSPSFLAPSTTKDGRISGQLTIDQPEQFWAPSRFLIIVRS